VVEARHCNIGVGTKRNLDFRSCRSSGGYLPNSHRGCPGSIPRQVMWDLWWTQQHWSRFSLSTSASIVIIP
jgi:hypothetical protein